MLDMALLTAPACPQKRTKNTKAWMPYFVHHFGPQHFFLQDSPVKPGPSKPEADCRSNPEHDFGPSPSSEPSGPGPMAEPGHEPTHGVDAGLCPSGPAPSVPATDAEHDVDLLTAKALLM